MFKKFRNKLDSGASAKAGSPGMDFLPDGYTERRRRRRTNAICLGLFIVVVGIVGLTFTHAERTLASVEAEYHQVDAQYAEAARRIEQVKQMREKQKTVADRMELTASLLEKLPRSNLLAEMTNALPPGVSLTDASLEATRQVAPAPAAQTSFDKKKAAAAPPPPPQPLKYDTTVTITGVAYTEGQVSDYINVLDKSTYFESVDLKWVRKGSNIDKQDDSMRTFTIALHIDPTAEARDHTVGGDLNPSGPPRLPTADSSAAPQEATAATSIQDAIAD